MVNYKNNIINSIKFFNFTCQLETTGVNCRVNTVKQIKKRMKSYRGVGSIHTYIQDIYYAVGAGQA
jgi:hypothetical protein